MSPIRSNANSTSYVYNEYKYSGSSSAYSSMYPSAGTTYSRSSGGGGGIKIKTFKDRQREGHDRDGNGSTSPAPDDSNDDLPALITASAAKAAVTEFPTNFDDFVADGDMEGGGLRPQEEIRGADMALFSDFM
jgi:hypothetical protein